MAKFCAECGSNLNEYFKFCPECGAKIISSDQHNPLGKDQTTSGDSSYEKEIEILICENCGEIHKITPEIFSNKMLYLKFCISNT